MLKILSIVQVKTPADAGPKLNRDQRVEVVRRLAEYETPRAIAKSLKQELGVKITPQAIAFYDPTRYAVKRSPKRWSALFWTLRAEFNKGKPDVGVAHRAVRLRWLDRMVCVQMEKGNTAEARALMKLAADEISQMAGQREEGSDESNRQLGGAELVARFAAAAAKLGYALVPLGDHTAAGGDRAVGQLQPPGEPLSG